LIDDRTVDIAIVGRKPVGPQYLAAPIFTERIVAFISTSPGGGLRELVVEAPIPAPELTRFPFVMREGDSGIHERALTCLHDAGCYPRRIIELGSNEAVRELVRSGVGIGLLSSSAVEPEIRGYEAAGWDGPGLQALMIEPWSDSRSHWLVSLQDRPLARTVRDFIDLLPVARLGGEPEM
jgi:DNA-binding transcriptional LysR family regulator